MCLAAINRLKRCRSLHGNSTSTGVCCGPAQFVFQFCDNHDELAATEVSPDEMAFFNATIEMCMNDDGGHGGGYDACTSAVYNASGCYFSRANMTGIYDKPHPECCAAWSNVQSQCGEPGDSVATVTNMLSKVMLNLDPYTFGYVANMSNYCPGGPPGLPTGVLDRVSLLYCALCACSSGSIPIGVLCRHDGGVPRLPCGWRDIQLLRQSAG
jgi:hypothetical protein